MPPPRLLALSSGLVTPRWAHPFPIDGTFTRFVSTQVQRQRRRRHQDPYAAAQARARKAANISRQATLQAERSKALGDPVHGITTPFVQSFDTAQPTRTGREGERSASAKHLNHFINAGELQAALDYSTHLTTPAAGARSAGYDEQKHQAALKQHKEESDIAAEAMRRITRVSNANSKDRMHLNIQRCIDTFGRHVTDTYLRPRPNLPADSGESKAAARAGPDTGSSEVQIAILTARIRTLSEFLEDRGKHDKVGKRNLRLLVHRRQKLLRYLRRRERGGERWQNVIETLGLTEGTWRGEISM